MPRGIYKRIKPVSEETKKKMSEAKKGKKRPPFSDETKRKISLAKIGNKNHLGVKCSEETKRKIGIGNRGKKRSDEMKRKYSEATRGDKNHNWKNGISPEYKRIRRGIEFRLWREAVFARDNWTCQKCKVKGGELHPHHIQNFAKYPELRFAIDNGITFCENCHWEFHKKYGKHSNTKEQLKEFLEYGI